ncbi:GDYXXLXY domain-containing protein [uncultured Psychrobacter sp.]|uniref:GDYXXLXY domain-containing protein n=1 Tax=uncultured Psychrobacter sp. TaxID=259303 RepID=UPI0034597CF9
MSTIKDKLLTKAPLSTAVPWWQKRAFTISVALLGLALIIVTMTINVATYESHLATGETILLELAPVDPRGFMQGDYMALRYALEDEVFAALNQDHGRPPNNAEGYIIVARDKNNVGQFVRLADPKLDSLATINLAANEMVIYYRIRNNTMMLATNAFFFQEGLAEAFEAAEYGQFRVNDKGEPLLTNMVDGEFNIIKGVSIDDTERLDNLENRGRLGSGM